MTFTTVASSTAGHLTGRPGNHACTVSEGAVAGRSRHDIQLRSGMTLIEVLIAMTIGTIVAGMAVSSFLLLGRSGASAAQYSQIAADARKSLEVVAQDIRMAEGLEWNSSTSVTLTVENNYSSSSGLITYAYDSDSTSPTYQCFYSKLGNATASTDKTVLIRSVSDFTFMRYNRNGVAAANDPETRRLGVNMTVRKTRSTLVPSTGDIVSASFYLRNK